MISETGAAEIGFSVVLLFVNDLVGKVTVTGEAGRAYEMPPPTVRAPLFKIPFFVLIDGYGTRW
ncbi:MAG: hypothetical protein H6816_15755 [Phycisphaerales bacterium]|nr:hypothetical protein [Phycisphaerales bacterium]